MQYSKVFAPVADMVIGLLNSDNLKLTEPEEHVLAVVEAPEFVNLDLKIIKEPEPVFSKTFIPVVPKSPLQFSKNTCEDADEEVNCIEVLSAAFKKQLFIFRIEAEVPDTTIEKSPLVVSLQP